jgi:hypothetical protein
MLAFILNLPLWGMFARFNCTLGTVQIPIDRLVPGLVSLFTPISRLLPRAGSIASPEQVATRLIVLCQLKGRTNWTAVNILPLGADLPRAGDETERVHFRRSPSSLK